MRTGQLSALENESDLLQEQLAELERQRNTQVVDDEPSTAPSAEAHGLDAALARIGVLEAEREELLMRIAELEGSTAATDTLEYLTAERDGLKEELDATEARLQATRKGVFMDGCFNECRFVCLIYLTAVCAYFMIQGMYLLVFLSFITMYSCFCIRRIFFLLFFLFL